MKVLTKEEVAEVIKSTPTRSHGVVAFGDEVSQLKSGEGFIIKADEWTRKTSVAGYFTTKFNKDGKKVVRTLKQRDGSHLIVKL